MTEPEAEIQATADLSPVSPSPVHTSAPLVVPSLQDTVETIDAMVETVASATDANLALTDPVDADDVVDDDSFNDPYGDDAETAQLEHTKPKLESLDSNDDYARTFDSPVEPEDGHDQDHDQHASTASSPPSNPQESNPASVAHETIDLNHSSELSSVAHDPTANPPTVPVATDLRSAHIEHATDPDSQVSDEKFVDDNETQDQSAPAKPTDGPDTTAAPEPQNSPSLDIQKLVADLTAQPAEPNTDSHPPTALVEADPPAGSASSQAPSTTLPPPSSLPPRPPQPHSTSSSYASQHHPAGANPSVTANPAALPNTGQAPAYLHGVVPATPTEATSSFPPSIATGLNASAYPQQATPGYPPDQVHDVEYQRKWDQFMTDERQYMSEAKWDRFPDGSRIFIGNLSSDKVSKRDVFDLFHRYGRLAQVSLKSAYGFVQYHTVEEGQRAMENLQGTEIKGRRIHLEISRVQDKSKKERNRSPDRGRGRDTGRGRSDKHAPPGRDDYRPGRNHSPRHDDYHSRDDGYNRRDRGYGDSGRGGRGRSRSPGDGYGRNDRDSYRRRSPSPHRQSRQEPELDLPRRYGADVPDVQIILQSDVNRDFVTWVEGGFRAKGLKTEVMFLHPRFPKEQVIQRQVIEGVHGIVDLDVRAQASGKIPVQVFDRSSGSNNVRFDQYVDLDPGTAGEVILRAKTSAATATYSQGYGAGAAYQNTYGGQHQQPGYAGGQRPGTFPQQHSQSPAVSAADIASLMGQVDNATLQRLLASMQGQAAPPSAPPSGYPNAPPATNPPVDIHALLGSLGSANTPQHAPPQGMYGGSFAGQQPNGGHPGSGGNSGDSAAQVQNIMAQLARYRQ